MKLKSKPSTILIHHLLDEKHSHCHRIFFGFIVGMFGVVIAHSASHMITPVNHIGDFVGYLTHGIGCVPFVNAIASKL